MAKPGYIFIKDYDYELPMDRIAKYPLADRDQSRLLHYESGNITSGIFRNAAQLLNKDDQLFFNTTRVVQARLIFQKESGARIEIFCLEPSTPADHQLAYASKGPVEFICLVGNAKKWKAGSLKMETEKHLITASVVSRMEDKFVIRFEWENDNISFAKILDSVGSTPIPPYLRREAEKADARTYQTVYAREDGSVAAPTAGLHFTENVLGEINKKGIAFNELTLHVGAGTFIPVKQENAVKHDMHAELVSVDKKLLLSLLKNKRNIAVGTTSTRSLESLYWLGVRAYQENDFSFNALFLDQWDAYDLNINLTLKQAIQALIDKMDATDLTSFSFHTRIMITPGYHFKVIDGLFTNFHQPKSTLLLLIAALIGDDWKKVYNYALKQDYRFLSYGDSSLLIQKRLRNSPPLV